MQKGQVLPLILAGVLILAVVAGGAYFLVRQNTLNPSDKKACTMEAKICPDGSGVGRVGPNCEFAECPVKESSSSADKSEKNSPKVESVLYQLYKSENRSEFVKTHDLDLINNRVRVIIELINPDYTLLSEFGIEESRYENLLQARIEIDKLLKLADNSNIKFIRSPLKAIPL